MVKITITNEQKVQVTLKPVSAAGQPAQVDGAPKWEVVDGDASLNISEDGFSAFLVSGTNLADSNIKVSADADLGAGVETIEDNIILTVVGAKAVGLGLLVGEPVPK